MTNNNEHINSLIQSYIQGGLTGQELFDFEEQLSTDIELREQVAVEQEMFNIFLDSDALNLKDMMNKDLNTKTTNKKSTTAVILLAITGIVILSTTTLLFLENSNSPITNSIEKTQPAQKITQIHADDNNHITTKVQDTITTKIITTINNDKKDSVSSVTDLITIESTQDTDLQDSIIINSSKIETDELPDSTQNTIPTATVNTRKTEEPLPEESLCSNITYTGSVNVEPSSYLINDGEILLYKSTITGGQAPYSYDLNVEGDFFETEKITELAPGTYTLFIKDANGCVAKHLSEVIIKKSLCKIDYTPTFDVSIENEWRLPLVEEKNAHIVLINKLGEKFVDKTILEGDDIIWNGKTDDNQSIDIGNYRWIIDYENEKCSFKMSVLN